MTYEEQKRTIIADLKGKLFREDWHGVADAAGDLRDLEMYKKGCLDTLREHASL